MGYWGDDSLECSPIVAWVSSCGGHCSGQTLKIPFTVVGNVHPISHSSVGGTESIQHCKTQGEHSAQLLLKFHHHTTTSSAPMAPICLKTRPIRTLYCGGKYYNLNNSTNSCPFDLPLKWDIGETIRWKLQPSLLWYPAAMAIVVAKHLKFRSLWWGMSTPYLTHL